MEQNDEKGVGLVKKDTKFMTNACMIAQRLNRVCDKTHRHVELINGKAKRAQVYPEEPYAEVLRGLMDQMKWEGRIRDTAIGTVFAVEEGEVEYMFWDDITGEPLDTEGVIKARTEEMAEFRKHGVYRKVPIEKCLQETGK